MNTLLAPQRPPVDTGPLLWEGRTPRTGLSDRIAMRVALGLLLWSTRPDPGEHSRTLATRAATARRERDWERARRLIHPTL